MFWQQRQKKKKTWPQIFLKLYFQATGFGWSYFWVAEVAEVFLPGATKLMVESDVNQAQLDTPTQFWSNRPKWKHLCGCVWILLRPQHTEQSRFNSPEVFNSARRFSSYFSNCWDNSYTHNVNMRKIIVSYSESVLNTRGRDCLIPHAWAAVLGHRLCWCTDKVDLLVSKMRS